MGSSIAEDQALDRVVALKVLHNQLTVDPGFIGRFEQEAKLAARLDHPNLVPIYDLGQIDGLFFIAMGLMAGGSLKDRLKKEGAFGSEKARDVFSQILQGVQVIHENNIIHRDLKPATSSSTNTASPASATLDLPKPCTVMPARLLA